MKLGSAYDYIVLGKRVTMRRWPVGTFVQMVKPKQEPGQLPKKFPFLVMHTPMQEIYPFLPNQAEFFGVDWELYDKDE